MEINGLEIMFQIVNFFILLFILQKIFYKPITKAMDARQERISKAEKEANSKMSEAEELIKNYDDKIENIESERKVILRNYRKEALDIQDSLIADYKNEADSKRKSYFDEVEEEKEIFIENLRQELGQSAVKIASKILATISSKELEEEVYKSFINDLKNIKDNVPNTNVLQTESNINLYSSKELSLDEKKEIELALKENIYKLENITYEIEKDLILGYELNLETYTIHNSIKNYLDEIQDNITDVLESQSS